MADRYERHVGRLGSVWVTNWYDVENDLVTSWYGPLEDAPTAPPADAKWKKPIWNEGPDPADGVKYIDWVKVPE